MLVRRAIQILGPLCPSLFPPGSSGDTLMGVPTPPHPASLMGSSRLPLCQAQALQQDPPLQKHRPLLPLWPRHTKLSKRGMMDGWTSEQIGQMFE